MARASLVSGCLENECRLYPGFAVITSTLLNVVDENGALNDCCAKISLGIQVTIRYGLIDKLISLTSVGWSVAL